MPVFPDLSALPVDVAANSLADHIFTVRVGVPKPWEDGMPEPDSHHELADGSWGRQWGDGPTILLAHGFEGRWSQWTPLAKLLLEDDVKVVVLEMPGHGRAEGLPASPLAFSRAITAAQKSLGPFKAVIGHSQGANGALHAIAKGVTTDKLALLAPVTSIEAYLRRVSQLVNLSEAGTALFLEKVATRVGVPPSEFDARSLAKAVDASVMIIHDLDDREAPFDEANALVQKWENAMLHKTTGLGHRRILNDKNVLTAISNFILDS